MVIFYTLPPDVVDYPYVLINANRPEKGLRYVVDHRVVVRGVLIDSGIEIFRDPRVKDYPGGFFEALRRQVALYRRVRAIVPRAEVWVTACDYCDDYHPRALWLSEDFTNIERTVVSVLTAVDFYPDVPWLIPVQGWYRDPRSLAICLEYYEQLGVLQRYSYLAIANLCTEKSCEIIERSVKVVWSWLRERGYDKKLHVFGLSLRCVDRVAPYIHSFDSTAWTRPCTKELHDRYPYSAKNVEQRVEFFREWLRRLERKLREAEKRRNRTLLDYGNLFTFRRGGYPR